MKKWCGRALVAVSLVLVVQARAQTQQYFLTAQPGPAGFVFSQVLVIDDAGTGVGFANQFGYCCDSSYLNDTPYVFRGAMASALNGPNGPNGGGGHAAAINNSGQVVGYDFDAPGFPFNEAVIWDHGVPKDIGVLYKDVQNFIGTSSAAAINNSGVVVGSTTTAPPPGNPNNGIAPQHAFSWKSGGKMTDLGALAVGSSSESSQANAISPSGIIVGQSVTATGFAHAVEFLNGKVIDLGALDGAKGTSEALSVSDSASGTTIVGSSDGDPVVWKGGKITALPTLGGIGGSATSINASGQIVGRSLNKAGEERATLWLNGKAIDLNSLIIPTGTKLPTGAILDTAYQITDNGLIEASYFATSSVDGSVSVHSYLLTPAVPTHIAISSTANPVSFGQSVKIIVHVIAASGASPGSFVTVMDGATVLAKPAIGNNGFASYTTSALSVGSHAITVSYDGKAPDGPSTSPVFTQKVDVTSTRTTLTSSANPATHGRKFTLTATVVPGFGSIAGSVTFKDGAATLGTVKLDPRTRQAALSTSIHTAGKHTLTADYLAAAGFNNSQSSGLTEVVD
jgi:probable HAF family extracellular repeat protein